MKTTDFTHATGFTLLLKQYIQYHGKIALVSILGMVAGLFILLYSIQRITRFDHWTYEHFMYVFIGSFIVLAILYAGSSFPGLRSKDRANHYLMLPVSTHQKFFFELFTRIVLFVLLMPTLYWISFNLEGHLIQLVNPNFTFRSFSFIEGFHLPTKYENALMISFVISQGLFFLTVPFLGATIFMKHQIIKTTAWGFGMLFVFFAFFNGYLEHNLKHSLLGFTSFLFGLNLSLVVLAYFKLKSKQVR